MRVTRRTHVRFGVAPILLIACVRESPPTKTLVFAPLADVPMPTAAPIDASLTPYVSDFDGALPAATYRPDAFAIPRAKSRDEELQDAMRTSSSGR